MSTTTVRRLPRLLTRIGDRPMPGVRAARWAADACPTLAGPLSRRQVRSLAAAAACAVAEFAISGCASGSSPVASRTVIAKPAAKSRPGAAAPARRRKPPPPSYPRLLGAATSSLPTSFVPAVAFKDQTAAWVARSQSGIALLSFNQRLLELRLHSGTVDAGAEGWRWGPSVTGSERRHLVAAFNGGFKLDTGAGGFVASGRVAVPLRDGLGSIVTYADGYTDIGSWRKQLPAPGRPMASVRQNLTLLIDNGRPAASLDCLSCWGAALGGVSDPARSALGITADGRLIWAGGEHLTPAGLANALLGARVVRAVELDINPEWVAAYLYGHRGGVGPLAPVPIVTGQPGIPGQFLVPYSRDFFTIVAR